MMALISHEPIQLTKQSRLTALIQVRQPPSKPPVWYAGSPQRKSQGKVLRNHLGTSPAAGFPAPAWAGTLLRWVEFHQPWAMMEVMMLGILVALVKIAELAAVIPGIGMFAVGVLIFLLAGMTVTFDAEEVWERVRWADGEAPRPPGAKSAGETGG